MKQTPRFLALLETSFAIPQLNAEKLPNSRRSLALIVRNGDSIASAIIRVRHPSSVLIDHLDKSVEFIIEIGAANPFIDLEIGITVIGGAHP